MLVNTPQSPEKITVFLYTLPSWVLPTISMILAGSGGEVAVNEIGANETGDWVLRRKFTSRDRDIWPQLTQVNEVWIELQGGKE